MVKQEETKKVKRPTALKRDEQHEKGRLRNKIYRSRMRTSIRHFDEVLAKGDEASKKDALKEVYSLLDKCVQKGVMKLNKASRTKSRLALRSVKV